MSLAKRVFSQSTTHGSIFENQNIFLSCKPHCNLLGINSYLFMTSLDIFVIGMDFQTDTNKMMATSDLCRVNEQNQTALKTEAFKQIKFECFHYRFCDKGDGF